MWIANSRTGLLVNTRYVTRIILTDTGDCSLVSAVIMGEERITTLERYKNHKEAAEAASKIYLALAANQDMVDMPDSGYYYEERRVKDARTKRKGGS